MKTIQVQRENATFYVTDDLRFIDGETTRIARWQWWALLALYHVEARVQAWLRRLYLAQENRERGSE